MSLPEILKIIRASYSTGEPLLSDQESKLFTQVETLYSSKNPALFRHNGMDIVVQKFEGLNNPADKLPWIEYKRLSDVYSRRMYNKFFVPIWLSVLDESNSHGYIVYPQLTPLRKVLDDFRDAKLPKDKYKIELEKILRLCFAPIALALDALHTPQPSRRTMYYHRDVCLGNIYMRTKGTYGEENLSKDYEDARIMLTEDTRSSSKEFVSTCHSLPKKYHYGRTFETSKEYHRSHDWKSFGVYILEVLNLLWPKSTSFDKIEDYSVFCGAFKEFIKASEEGAKPLGELEDIKPQVLQYIDIASECLKQDQNQKREYNYELERNMLKFEYKISLQTTKLLKLYEESRPIEYVAYNKPMEHGADKADCQACLMCPQVMDTKVHRESGCDSGCKFYCFQCYTSGERLFCSDGHGTASTSLGHHSSYAILFYGEDFSKGGNKDLFKESMEMVRKTLMSKLICGIKRENIKLAPLFGERKPDGGEGFLTPLEAFANHCTTMQQHIHSDENPTCCNNADYTIFLFYCGHGCSEKRRDVDYGDWVPTKNSRITKEDVSEYLKIIWTCPKSYPLQCKAKCVTANCFMEHCYPTDRPLSPVGRASSSATFTSTAASFGKEVRKAEGSIPKKPDISRWLTLFLRSRFREGCTCIVKQGEKCVCSQIRDRVNDEWKGRYLDSRCLELHSKHIPSEFLTKITVEYRGDDIPLAYYHPQGVFLKVFPYTEGGKVLELDFDCDMTCDKLEREIKEKLNSGKKKSVCLLTSRSDDECEFDYSKYDLVPDDPDKIYDMIDSQVLFYYEVQKPVKVTLGANGSRKSVTIELPLNKRDLEDLVFECQSAPTVLKRKESQLPNLLVYVVYYWRYQKEVTVKPSEQTSQDVTQCTPADNALPMEATKAPTTEELVKKSFVNCLMGERMPTLTQSEWKEVEDKAKGYLGDINMRPFQVTGEGKKAIIAWYDPEQGNMEDHPTELTPEQPNELAIDESDELATDLL